MKKLLLLPIIFYSLASFSQVTNRIQADSVKMYQSGGANAELILENGSRNLTGAFLKNKLNGRTVFGYALDSVWSQSGFLKFRYGPTTLSFTIAGVTQQALDDTAAALRAAMVDTIPLPNALLSGGSISYKGTGYNFYIQEAYYRLTNVYYNSDSGSVTLGASDPTYDRFDLIYLGADNQFHVRPGTPAEAAAIPQAEGDEWALTAIKVPAGSTAPDFSQIYVYNENTEGWTVTNIGTTTDPNATGNAWIGTKSINVTTVNNGDVIGIKRGAGPVNVANASAFSLAIKFKLPLLTAASVRATFFGNGVAASNEVIIPVNKNSIVFQAVSMPLALFNIQNYNIDSIRFRYLRNGSTASHPGFHIDAVNFITGFTQPGAGQAVTGIAVTVPPALNANVTPGTGNVNIAITAPGTSAQIIHGDGVARTYTAATSVGTYNTQPHSPNGAVITAQQLFNQPVTDSMPGLATPALKKDVDTLKALTAESLGDGVPIIKQIDGFRTGFPSFKNGTNTTVENVGDTVIKIHTTGTLGKAAEGLQVSSDTVKFGGPVSAPAYISTNRNIMANRKAIIFGNGVEGAALWQFSDSAYSPFQFLTKDTITSNDANPSYARPLSGIFARREIYFTNGIYRQNKSYGHSLSQIYNWQDSVVARTDGGDYTQAVHLESRLKPRGTGTPQVLRTGHGTGDQNRLFQGMATVVSNTYMDSNGSDRLKINGTLVGFLAYLVHANNVNDTINNYIAYGVGNLQTGKTLKYYGLAPQLSYANIDSAYLVYDTASKPRVHWRGNSVFGYGATQSSSDKLRVYGNVNVSDSLIVGTQTTVTDTSGMDIVLRRRSDGSYVKIRPDLLGLGGGSYSVFNTTTNGLVPMSSGGNLTHEFLRKDASWGVPTLQDVLDWGNVSTATNIFMSNASRLLFDWYATPGAVGFSSGTSQPVSKLNTWEGSLLYDSSIVFRPAGGTGLFHLDGSLITAGANRRLKLPDQSGTIALLSDIAGGGYTLPAATGSVRGGIVVGTNLGISGDVLSAHSSVRKNTSGTTYEASRFNLIEGTGISITLGNSSGDNDVTITATGGSAPSLTQYRLAVGDASNLLSSGSAITGNRALISDANGVPTHSATTNTELGYVSGVTSAIQTQFTGKASTSLGNLSSVAITTPLLPSSDNATDFGSSSFGWKDAYIRRVLMKGSTSGTAEIKSGPLAQVVQATTLDGTGNIQSNYDVFVRSDETLTNTTSEQDMFSASAHNTFAVLANTTYRFKISGRVTHNSGTSHALAFGMVPTTATITNIQYVTGSWTTAVNVSSNAANWQMNETTTTANNLLGAHTLGTQQFTAEGWFTVGATGGFITPRLKFSVDPTGTILLKTGAEAVIWVAGNNTFTETAPWQ
ncbi:MAG: hypothetical protein ABI675_19390 [Chitinophagaceae bacterium]